MKIFFFIILPLILVTSCAPQNLSINQLPETARIVVKIAITDLSTRVGVSESVVSIISVKNKTWQDSSLGCPQPGFFYSQVITPGYRIVLRANNNLFTYHTDENSSVIFCELDNP